MSYDSWTGTRKPMNGDLPKREPMTNGEQFIAERHKRQIRERVRTLRNAGRFGGERARNRSAFKRVRRGRRPM